MAISDDKNDRMVLLKLLVDNGHIEMYDDKSIRIHICDLNEIADINTKDGRMELLNKCLSEDKKLKENEDRNRLEEDVVLSIISVFILLSLVVLFVLYINGYR